MPTPSRYEIIGITGIDEVHPGDDVARIIVDAATAQATPLATHDVLVVGQKIISKAEGRLLRLSTVEPSAATRRMADALGRDPHLLEVIMRESRRVVRMDKGVIITETHHGWICANAGVDQSNVDADTVALLPEDPDRSARLLRERVLALAGAEVAVIVADTFGRPWREGLTNVAIGLAGMAPLRDYIGMPDSAGRPLQMTMLAVADELASAAEIVMGKLDRIPAAIVRGLRVDPGDGGSKSLLRDPAAICSLNAGPTDRGPRRSFMNIAILGGTGKEGAGLGARWALAGRSIIIGSRDEQRGPRQGGGAARPHAQAHHHRALDLEAAQLGEVIVLALPASVSIPRSRRSPRRAPTRS